MEMLMVILGITTLELAFELGLGGTKPKQVHHMKDDRSEEQATIRDGSYFGFRVADTHVGPVACNGSYSAFGRD